MRAALLGLAAALAAWPAGAQERSSCEVSIGRGATQLSGSNGLMRVESGRSCGAFTMYRPDRNEPTSSLALTSPPAHGVVTITQPNRFDYMPATGFVGQDRFVITGQPSPFRVTMTVTVTPSGRR